MRRLLTGAMVVLLAGGAVVAARAGGQVQAREALCRRAPALPLLPAETQVDQHCEGREGRGTEERLRTTVPPPVVAAPSALGPSPLSVPRPPPPPPPPVPERGGSEDVVVTGGRMTSPSPVTSVRDRGEARTEASRAIPRRFDPPPGLLTAGDHDDLLNPLLYARYAFRAARDLGQQIAGLPQVDTRRTLTVEVRDANGRPAPFVPVRVGCSDGNFIELATLADGKVVLFPALDRLGERVTLSVPGARREVTIDRGSGGQVQTMVASTSARPVRAMDLMIALDATGSMGDEIAFLRSELRAILDHLRRDYPGLDLRVGLVSYRDIGDDYVTRTLPLTADFGAAQQRLATTSGRGGGDMPEAMDQALIRAVGQEWRPGAVRSLLLVADAPPHDDKQGIAFAAVEAARARRVQIVPVASSGVDDRAEYFMRAAAAATQSRYVFLTDDSGIGNPHAEPQVDCYVVTSLASAIRRVLASQVTGGRVEPMPQEVVRVAGRYDHGRCILPPRFSVQ